MNSINIIRPYVFETQWVFDDPSKGLDKEPFVSGADNIIDALTQDMADADKGFILLFSAQPFPGNHAKFVWDKADQGGNWYHDFATGIQGWLCPALLKYFDEAPKAIYVQVKESD